MTTTTTTNPLDGYPMEDRRREAKRHGWDYPAHDNDGRLRAKCRCGWSGTWRHGIKDVRDDYSAHLMAAFIKDAEAKPGHRHDAHTLRSQVALMFGESSWQVEVLDGLITDRE